MLKVQTYNLESRHFDILKSVSKTIIVYTIMIIIALYLSSRNFKAFHTMVELFCVVIGFGVSIISINTYKLNKNNRIIFLGIAFGYIATINLLHFLSYKGFNIIEMSTFNTSIQLWTGGTYLQSIALLICFSNPNKKYNLIKLELIYSTILVIFLLSIFYFNVFPDCYVEGKGSTNFKIISGFINTGILFVGLVYLKNETKSNLTKSDIRLSLFMLWSIISHLFFIYSRINNDIFSVLGHLSQLFSYMCIYIALVQTSLREPYYSLEKLNNDLKIKNENLENLISRLDLEYKVRKSVEDEREKKEQILNGILDSVIDGILVVNNNKKIIHVNKNFWKVIGSPFEITNRTLVSQIIDFAKENVVNIDEFEERIERKMNENEEYVGNIYFKNGKVFEGASSPFTYNNSVEGRVIRVRDVTEKIKVQKLEKEVEIKQILLEKANEFDEIRTNFFCTISHELKTPINIILGVIQLLSVAKEKDLDYIRALSADKYVNMMKQNCYRLIKLSNNLIDITKIDSGYTEVLLKNHNIVSVIEDITLSVADYVKSKNIELVFDTDVEEKIIACDDEKLERVMLNLLSNAIKFTKKNGIINVNITDKNDYIIISVKDSGIGIPKDKIDIIFDRFMQVDSSLTREKQGSGIGLALVKSIIEKHNGKISLKSEVGKGSEFIIEIPVKVQDHGEVVDKIDECKDLNVDRINIELSDIYGLNIY